MRMKPLTDKQIGVLLSPIWVPVVALVLPVAAMIAPFVWLTIRIGNWREARMKKLGLDRWHDWFAWHPVLISGFWYDQEDRFVWLEPTKRRLNRHGTPDRKLPEWESRYAD